MILPTMMSNNFITKKKNTMIMAIKRMKRHTLMEMSKSLHLNRLTIPSFKKGKKFSLNTNASSNLHLIKNLILLYKNLHVVEVANNLSLPQVHHLEEKKY